MNPDPYASGDVGLIPAIFLYILFAWISRAQKTKISKTEEVAFNIFSYIAVYVLLFPLHLMMGFLFIGVGVIASPAVEAITGFSIKEFVNTYIWVDGSFLSFIWTAVIGALPSMFVPVEEWLKRKKDENKSEHTNKEP